MPPKKNKGKKRGATDEEDIKDTEEEDEITKQNDSTELLSPSEVVKMRKKTRPLPPNSSQNGTADGKTEKQKTKSTRTSDKDKPGEKKAKTKDNMEKKEKSKSKKENADDKKSRNFRERRRPTSKKKSNSEESDEDTNEIMYPCGICMKEVSDADEAILCEAGCEFWYHRNCTGMTDIAYQFLTNEENCEWVCDKCIATKAVPLVKVKMQAV